GWPSWGSPAPRSSGWRISRPWGPRRCWPRSFWAWPIWAGASAPRRGRRPDDLAGHRSPGASPLRRRRRRGPRPPVRRPGGDALAGRRALVRRRGARALRAVAPALRRALGRAWLGRVGGHRREDRRSHGPVRAQVSPDRAGGHAARRRGALRPRTALLGAGLCLGGGGPGAEPRLRDSRAGPRGGGGAAGQPWLTGGDGEDRAGPRRTRGAVRHPRGLLCPEPRRLPRPRGRDQGAGMNFTLGRKIAVGFSIALALLVLIAWASFKSLGELTQNAQRVEETYQTLQTLESILARIIDVETGERGFLISGADHYLEPYRAARDSVRQEIATARRLTDANPAQRQRLDLLEPLIARKLALVAQSITERERDSKGGLDVQALLEQGQSTMDEIRTLIFRMKAEEHRLLVERADSAVSSRRNALLIVGLGCFSAIALIGAAESELKAAEERYRMLFDRSQSGIFRTTREGVLLECNQAFARMLGYRTP